MQRNYVVTSVLEYKHYEYVFLTQDRYIYIYIYKLSIQEAGHEVREDEFKMLNIC